MKNALTEFTNEELIQEMISRGYLRVLWHTDDIFDRAESRNIRLSQTQADLIAKNIVANHDCNIGLSWEIMDIFIDDNLNP